MVTARLKTGQSFVAFTEWVGEGVWAEGSMSVRHRGLAEVMLREGAARLVFARLPTARVNAGFLALSPIVRVNCPTALVCSAGPSMIVAFSGKPVAIPTLLGRLVFLSPRLLRLGHGLSSLLVAFWVHGSLVPVWVVNLNFVFRRRALGAIHFVPAPDVRPRVKVR